MPEMDEAILKRVLPHSIEAEQSVIGAMLMDKEAITIASEQINSDDFYGKQYGILFDTMVELNDEGKPVDLITLQDRLKEKGAILNWFDITEVEGHLSLNDKMSDVLRAPEGAALFQGMMAQAGIGAGTDVMGFEMNEGMMQMMGGFTVIRLTSLLGMTGLKMTKEQLLGLNAQLNKIKKPE